MVLFFSYLQYGSIPAVQPLKESFPDSFYINRSNLVHLSLMSNNISLNYSVNFPQSGEWYAIALIPELNTEIKQKVSKRSYNMHWSDELYKSLFLICIKYYIILYLQYLRPSALQYLSVICWSFIFYSRTKYFDGLFSSRSRSKRFDGSSAAWKSFCLQISVFATLQKHILTLFWNSY